MSEALCDTDRLTGLFNSRYAMNQLRELIHIDNSIKYRAVGVVFADIFHFSELNCCLGHLAGDEVLLAIAEIAKSVARAGEIVCRYGYSATGNYTSDEFLIVLPGVTEDEAMRRANELLEAVEKTPLVIAEKQEYYVRLSIGVAHSRCIAPELELDGAEALMRVAEADLRCDRERNVARARRAIRQTNSR